MRYAGIVAVLGLIGLAAPGPAEAHVHHWRHWHHWRYHWHHGYSHAQTMPIHIQVLERNALGDRIISGKIGFHRADWDGMVPDSQGPDFILKGRASRAGFDGANGIPGSNLQ